MPDLFQWHMELILIVIGVVSTIVLRRSHRRRKKHDGPPTPPSIPIIGHPHLLLSHPLFHRALHNLSTRYGPIFQMFVGSTKYVVVSTPETAKHFLKTHESYFFNRASNAAIHYLTYGSRGFVFAPYGAYWKFIKKVCMSHLLGGRTLELLRPVRRSETLRFLRVLTTKAKGGEAIHVGEELMTLSINILSRMIMGPAYSGNHEIRKLVMDTMEAAVKFNPLELLFGGRFNFFGINKGVKQCRARFDNFMDGVINQHQQERRKRKQLVGEQNGQPRGLLDILLDILEDDTSEIKLTKFNIKALLLDLFMAGTDTTIITIQWALSELINHPNIMEKARQEIYSVVGESRVVEESDIVNLPYLEAIVKETLRLHPAFTMVTRKSNESCNVCGYDIPANTILLVNLWSIGRDPSFWDEPHEFRPERFMSGDGRGQHFELMSFGSGRRACPGASLGLNVVQANLGAIIQCFDWKVDGDKQTVDMEEKASLTIPRANPLICYLVPRLHPFPS